MSEQNIYRLSKHVNGFTTYTNDIINHPHLTANAKLVLFYLLAKPSEWVLTYGDIVKTLQITENAVMEAVKSLERNDYIYRLKRPNELGKIEWITKVFESPELCREWKDSHISEIKKSLDGSTGKRRAKRKTDDNHRKVAIPEISENKTIPEISGMDNHTRDLRSLIKKEYAEPKNKDSFCPPQESGGVENPIPEITNLETPDTIQELGGHLSAAAGGDYPADILSDNVFNEYTNTEVIMTTDKPLEEKTLCKEKLKYAQTFKSMGAWSSVVRVLMLDATVEQIASVGKSLSDGIREGRIDNPIAYVTKALERQLQQAENDSVKEMPLNTPLAFDEFLGYLQPRRKSEFVMEYLPRVEDMPFRVKLPTSPTIFKGLLCKVITETCEYTQEKTTRLIMEYENYLSCPFEWIEFVG